MTLCPGKVQRGARSGDWDRDLAVDMKTIRDWGARALLNLLTPGEMRALEVPGLPQAAGSAGIRYFQLPIDDAGVPDAAAMESWESIGRNLREHLVNGDKVLLHCKGGLGRTGMMAGSLLVELGCAPDRAIRLIRTARPGAIETAGQEEFVRHQGPCRDPALRRVAITLDLERNRDRFLGCVLGGAVGDALGAPVEFMSAADIQRTFGKDGLRDYAPAYGRRGAITDDTQMTLFTAEGMIRAWVRGVEKGISSFECGVARAYLRWLRTQGESSALSRENEQYDPGWLLGHGALHARRAPGNTCLSALRAMRNFGDLAKNDSKGCGGVMRVAPAGLFGWHLRDNQTMEETFEVGANLARMTHGHPTGYLTGGVFAVLIRALVEGSTLADGLSTARRSLSPHAGHEETLAAINAAEELARSAVPRSEAIARLGQGWVADEALAIGLYAALAAKDFSDGVLLAVNHGGDSDSTGSIAGNLLGAQLRVGAIPEKWLSALELRDVITELVMDLYSIIDWGQEGSEYPGSEEALRKKYPPW